MTRGNVSRAANRDNVLILYAWADKGSSRKNEKGITSNNGYYKGWLDRIWRPAAKYNSKILSMTIEPGRNYGILK